MAKETPWLEIKAAYLKGVQPKELAIKYKLKAKTISDKANKENWVDEKAKICEKVREKTQDKIDRITDIALRRLEDVLCAEDVRTSDLVSAIGKAFDISGLKLSKQEITGKDGAAFAVQKVYVTPQMQKEAEAFTKELLNG